MPTNPVSILLIDDDDIEAEMVERSLRKARIANDVYRARDGEQGLELLRGENGRTVPNPIMVLLDLNMPRMSGLEFLDIIRQDEKLKGTVVFVLTTSNDERDKIEAYNRFVSGYIVKSSAGPQFTQLIDMIEHFWKVVEFPEA